MSRAVMVGPEPIPVRIVGPLYRLVCLCLAGMHLVLVGVMTWWAAILAYPVETFPTSQSYRHFETHWPHTEPGWACLFLLAALVGVPGLLPIYGRPHNRRITSARIVSATALAMAHGWLAFVIGAANPGSTGTGAYTAFALLGTFRIACEILLVMIVLEQD